MIIYEKEERPFVETPDPRLGVVLSRLNELSLSVEMDINTDHNLAKEELSKITGLLGAYSTELRNLVTTHINKRGAVHNEDKGDVGLPDVDNYRKASKNEVLEGSDVDAWVTVGDAKEKIDKAKKESMDGDYQTNVRVNFNSYFSPNKFPTKVLSGVGNDRYVGLTNPTHGLEELNFLVSNNRLVYSTLTTAKYGTTPNVTNPGNKTFITSPLTDSGGFSVSERSDIDVDEIISYGLNSELGRTFSTNPNKPSELVVLRRTSKIIEITKFPDLSKSKVDSIGLTEIRDKNTSALEGLMTNIHIPSGNNVFEVRHCLVKARQDTNALELVPGNTVSWNGLSGKLTQAQNLYRARNISDYITPAPGQTIKIDTSIFLPKVSYGWLVPNKKVKVNLLIPILVTENGKTGEFKLSITEDITLPLGGVGGLVVEEVGIWKKSVLLGGLKTNLEVGSYLSKRDPNNALDLSYGSGVLTTGGTLIKGVKTPQALHLKRFLLKDMRVKELLEAQVNNKTHPTHEGVLFSHVVNTPGLSKPYLPTDIIDLGNRGFLVKGLDHITGEQTWYVNELNNGKMNDSGSKKTFIVNPPKELISYIYRDSPTGRVRRGLSGMIFQESNNYTGYTDISFDEEVFNRKGVVKLSGKTVGWFREQQLLLMSTITGRPSQNIKPTGFMAELPVYNQTTGAIKKVFLAVNSVFKQGSDPQALISTNYRVSGGILEYLGRESFAKQPVKSGQPNLTSSKDKDNKPELYSLNSDSGDSLDSNGLKTKSSILENNDVRFEFYGVGGSFNAVLRVDINPTSLKITNLKLLAEPDYYYRNSNINVRGAYDLSQGSGLDVSLGINNSAGIKGEDFILPVNTEFVMEGIPYRLKDMLLLPFTEVSGNRNKDGVSYIYLIQMGNTFILEAHKEMREPSRYELLVATYGLDNSNTYKQETDYILLDEFLISPNRRGNAAAAFDQDNVNRFFKVKDIIDL